MHIILQDTTHSAVRGDSHVEPEHSVLVYQLTYQLLALIYLVEVELLLFKLLPDKLHVLWRPLQTVPEGEEDSQEP